MVLLRPTRPASGPGLALGRLLALAGVLGYSCTFPRYIFEADALASCQNGILDGNEERIDCGGQCTPCPGSECQPDDPNCQPATCTNGVQDGDETGVDCGNSCPLCAGTDCDHDTICSSRVCLNGKCAEPACDDKETNGDETDLNCGGSCPPCSNGSDCKVGSDCESKVCNNGYCQEPTCSDTVQNGAETDIDCGAEECPCDIGKSCETDDNCQSGICDQMTCVQPHCTNGRVDRDLGETDEDCGGPCAGCDTGGACEGIDENCKSGVCGIDHTCLAASCSDDTQNGDETDVDCGGDPQCAKCMPGQKCKQASDCAEYVCTEGECAEPTCSDRVHNGDETDIDCGGDCDPCAAGKGCDSNDDCESNHCLGICVEANCDDGIQNDNEVAVDCGGDCPLCGLGSDCGEDAHCASNLCDGSCEVGLQLKQGCTRCGSYTDAIGFQVELTNVGNSDFPISELALRYYFSADFDTPYVPVCLDCDYNVSVEQFSGTNAGATHFIQVDFSNATEPLAPQDTLTAQIVVDWTVDDFMDQANDYSFRSGSIALSNSTTLYRNGVLIWGVEPPNSE